MNIFFSDGNTILTRYFNISLYQHVSLIFCRSNQKLIINHATGIYVLLMFFHPTFTEQIINFWKKKNYCSFSLCCNFVIEDKNKNEYFTISRLLHKRYNKEVFFGLFRSAAYTLRVNSLIYVNLNQWPRSSLVLNLSSSNW